MTKEEREALYRWLNSPDVQGRLIRARLRRQWVGIIQPQRFEQNLYKHTGYQKGGQYGDQLQ